MRISGTQLEELKKQIQKLHQQGLSSVAIGFKLKRDHSTILHHLKAMGLKSTNINCGKIISMEKALINPTRLPNIEVNYLKEKLNEGKSYAEYLEKEKELKLKAMKISRKELSTP
jgi:IS30 family transposase